MSGGHRLYRIPIVGWTSARGTESDEVLIWVNRGVDDRSTQRGAGTAKLRLQLLERPASAAAIQQAMQLKNPIELVHRRHILPWRRRIIARMDKEAHDISSHT